MWRRKKSSSSTILGAIDVPGAEPAAGFHEHRERDLRRQLFLEPGRGRGHAVRLEEPGCLVLVLAEADRLEPGQEHQRAELVPPRGKQPVVEIGERHHEARAVLGDESGERGDVARVADRRHDRTAIGGVQGRGELVQVGRDGRRSGAPERLDDVDALAGAGKEDDGHGGEAYFSVDGRGR